MVKDERERQIIDNIGLVHSIAKRFLNRGCEYEDLFQAGCVGLIKAVDGFDSSKGFMFSTYAVPVIMGEIRRIFREGGAVKVSRSLKEKSYIVQCARDKFVKKELREPTISELSDICKIEACELGEILGVISPTISLSVENDNGTNEFDIPIDNSEELIDKVSVSYVLGTLNAEEKKLVYLRYYEGKTQCETSKHLNISQVQVSRKEKAILNKLKKFLSD